MQPQTTLEIAPVISSPETIEKELSHIDSVARDLNYILSSHSSLLENEGLKRKIAILKEWLESYRAGLIAANKITETAPTWLPEIKDRLKLVSDELHRYEGEGGNPPPKTQIVKTTIAEQKTETVQHIITELESLLNGVTPVHI